MLHNQWWLAELCGTQADGFSYPQIQGCRQLTSGASSLQELAHYCVLAHIWATHGLEFVNGTSGCGEPGDNDTLHQPVLGGTTGPLELQGHLPLWGNFHIPRALHSGRVGSSKEHFTETKAEELSGTNRESTARAFPQNSHAPGLRGDWLGTSENTQAPQAWAVSIRWPVSYPVCSISVVSF